MNPKSKIRAKSSTESESGESERFNFLPIPETSGTLLSKHYKPNFRTLMRSWFKIPPHFSPLQPPPPSPLPPPPSPSHILYHPPPLLKHDKTTPKLTLMLWTQAELAFPSWGAPLGVPFYRCKCDNSDQRDGCDVHLWCPVIMYWNSYCYLADLSPPSALRWPWQSSKQISQRRQY